MHHLTNITILVDHFAKSCHFVSLCAIWSLFILLIFMVLIFALFIWLHYLRSLYYPVCCQFWSLPALIMNSGPWFGFVKETACYCIPPTPPHNVMLFVQIYYVILCSHILKILHCKGNWLSYRVTLSCNVVSLKAWVDVLSST